MLALSGFAVPLTYEPDVPNYASIQIYSLHWVRVPHLRHLPNIARSPYLVTVVPNPALTPLLLPILGTPSSKYHSAPHPVMLAAMDRKYFTEDNA